MYTPNERSAGACNAEFECLLELFGVELVGLAKGWGIMLSIFFLTGTCI